MDKPIDRIANLAEDAAWAVGDLFDEEGWKEFMAWEPIEKIRWRYCHADCDDFALVLHEITGWRVVCLANTRGPVHRLVEAPDGRLVDAGGWVTMDDLKVRYRSRALRVLPDDRTFAPIMDSNQDRYPIVDAMRVLNVAPFDTPAFLELARQYCLRLKLEDSFAERDR